jgi:hypothetical protein
MKTFNWKKLKFQDSDQESVIKENKLQDNEQMYTEDPPNNTKF